MGGGGIYGTYRVTQTLPPGTHGMYVSESSEWDLRSLTNSTFSLDTDWKVVLVLVHALSQSDFLMWMSCTCMTCACTVQGLLLADSM